MSTSMGVDTTKHGSKVPWGDILLSAIAAVSWALIGMAGVAALGLHLLEADSTASLGPMTAAVVALGAGGSVTPSGDVSAFGLTGAEAATAIEITPLGVSLVGALLLSWFFLRSLRAAGVVVAPAELLARAGVVVALFVATLGGLAWAGHDVITIDGSALGLDDLPGGGGGGGGLEIPGLGDVGDIGGLLPDQIGDLVDAKAAVGFTVDTVPTLLGGLVWSAGVLLIALLASRRTPLPRGWEAVHRVVRPAVSALVTVLLVAVAAGLAAAAYASIGDDHPKRIAGAALLGTPNGTWLGIPIGLFVPWDGRATGPLAGFLPDPLDDLLSSERDQSVSLSRLAELDGRVWLLGVAAAMMLLLAGVLAAVRTPVGVRGSGGGAQSAQVRDPGALGFAGRCALRLGIVTALALPLLAWMTEVSVNASLSVLGFDAFGAGIELHGQLGMALLIGALWGAGAGAVGALLARATGAAGNRAAPLALSGVGGAPDAGQPPYAGGAGAYPDSPGRYPGESGSAPHGGPSRGAPYAGASGADPYAGTSEADRYRGDSRGAPRGGEAGAPPAGGESGPYTPGAPYRPPNPATNPYLQVPDELREPEDARPSDARPPRRGRPPDGVPPGRGPQAAEGGRRPGTPPPGQGYSPSGPAPGQGVPPGESGWRPGQDAPPSEGAWRAGTRPPGQGRSPSGQPPGQGPQPGESSRRPGQDAPPTEGGAWRAGTRPPGQGRSPSEPPPGQGPQPGETSYRPGQGAQPTEGTRQPRTRPPGQDRSPSAPPQGQGAQPGESGRRPAQDAPPTEGGAWRAGTRPSGQGRSPSGAPAGPGDRPGEGAWRPGAPPPRQGRPSSSAPPGQGARPGEGAWRGEVDPTAGPPPGGDESPPAGDDLYGAPTMVRPIEPPPRRMPSGREPSTPDDGPPPPPPPPPPGRPKGRR
ncbi:streptophobe family protein [Streptomyces sp. NPDC051001]|uniref:streptophobe family protein n=1 Tax=Streptomyces sp. NPDC051001 TaxID=3155795 RepID=UPI0034430249